MNYPASFIFSPNVKAGRLSRFKKNLAVITHSLRSLKSFFLKR